MRRITTFILLIAALAGCSSRNNATNEKTIFVSITPLRGLVEEITCGDFDVEVIVPDGSSPESYEPTARQLAAMSDAEAIYAIGLIDFEQSIIERIDSERIVDLSSGIEVMEGCCSHGHHAHSHGIDPHIWTSPRALRTMVASIEHSLTERYPDSTKYTAAAEELMARIDELDTYCHTHIEDADVEAIMIYHPAYTYYARDYGIEQIAIEHDGKEPTPRRLTALVDEAQRRNIGHIFLQPQYSLDKVRAIAEECDAEIIVTDPLAEDIIEEIRRITDIICM